MKCVLITGATGAVGSALVPVLLRDSGASARLVLRAKSDEHLRERLNSLFAFWARDPNAPALAGRVTAVRGDVSQPNLGLTADDHAGLVREVTHVVHAAGDVKLNKPLAEARASAVDSARHIVAFARACLQFRKLEYLSTVGVAGRTSGLVREDPLPHIKSFHNTYEQAKAEAETYLLGEMQSGFPATVHRPSMVVGDAHTGAIIHFQVFYYLAEFFSGMATRGVVPSTGQVRLDIIPADYVARAIDLSSRLPEATGRILHLCSGPDFSLKIADLTTELRRLFQAHGANVPRLRRLPARLVRYGIPLVRPVVGRRTKRLLQTLPFFLDYLEEVQVFDNARSREFFAAHGLDIPRVANYLPHLIRYYWDRKHGSTHPSG